MNVRKIKWLRRKSFVGRMLRFPFKLIPNAAVLPIVTGPLRGSRWVKGSHNISVVLGTYEKTQSHEFYKCAKEADVLWDLGAHVGYYSLLYHKARPLGNIIAFEPMANNAELFEKHMLLNNVSGFTLNKVAVSNEQGTLSFNTSATTVAGKLSKDGKTMVNVIKLSEWLKDKKIPAPKIIKMDIEGEEFKVLLDIVEMLKIHRPKIFLSTHGPIVHSECIRFLKELNYFLKPLDAASLEGCNEVLAY